LSLQSELRTLFDKHTIMQAKQIPPDVVDALAVNQAAGALLRLKGQPVKQVELVRAMQPEIAAALCRWLTDPTFWCMVGNIKQH
jgi:hypothetical protein